MSTANNEIKNSTVITNINKCHCEKQLLLELSRVDCIVKMTAAVAEKCLLYLHMNVANDNWKPKRCASPSEEKWIKSFPVDDTTSGYVEEPQ